MSPTQMSGNGWVVYVVEDEPAIRDSIAMLLSTAGIAARLYASAAAFFDDYRSRPDACLLLDGGLPGHSTLQVLRDVRSRHPALPVILMTADDELHSRVRAAPDAPPLLRKPFGADELFARVTDALGPRHAA